jgi:iron(III) transport system ATP-binding protein
MISVENLHVRYRTERGEVHAVRGVNLEIERGRFFTLLGPSGCGKTTTLRCLAGLETPNEGRIVIDGEAVFDSATGRSVPAYRRDIGMVFQSYAIWPHMTVFENVAFPLVERRPRPPRAEIRERVLKALALVQLAGLEDRPAPFLSGGQQQRLALARALVKEPKVLLLDEPLSNLDAKLREETRGELRQLVDRLGITTVYVTHDQIEALTMADVVAVMEHGRIVQQAAPADIYRRPETRFVASFIGQTNFLDGRVRTAANGADSLGVVDTAFGSLRCVLPDRIGEGEPVTVVVRPEDVRLADAPSDRDNVVDGEVASVVYLGDALDCQIRIGGATVRIKVHPSAAVAAGRRVKLAINGRDCRGIASG